MEEIFRAMPTFIVDYVNRSFIENSDIYFLKEEQLLRKITSLMDYEQKKKTIDLILIYEPKRHFHYEYLKEIIHEETNMYNYLLTKTNLVDDIKVILSPLYTHPNTKGWRQMAIAAIGKGVRVSQIVDLCLAYENLNAHIGPISKYYESLVNSFEELLTDENLNIRKIAKLGIKKAEKELNHNYAQEKYNAVYGRD